MLEAEAPLGPSGIGRRPIFLARWGFWSSADPGIEVALSASESRPASTDLVVDTRRLHFFDPETGLGIFDGAASTSAASRAAS